MSSLGFILLAVGVHFLFHDNLWKGIIIMIISAAAFILSLLSSGCQDENLRAAAVTAARASISPEDQAVTMDCELCSEAQRQSCINRSSKESISDGIKVVIGFLVLGICGLLINGFFDDELPGLAVIGFVTSGLIGITTLFRIIVSRLGRNDHIDIQNCPKTIRNSSESR